MIPEILDDLTIHMELSLHAGLQMPGIVDGATKTSLALNLSISLLPQLIASLSTRNGPHDARLLPMIMPHAFPLAAPNLGVPVPAGGFADGNHLSSKSYRLVYRWKVVEGH